MNHDNAFLYQFDTEIGAVNEDNELFQLRILRNGKGEGSTLAVELDQALYTAISDHIGSIRCLVDVEKVVVGKAYRYSAFGEQQAVDSGVLGNPWGFVNKRRDADTGHIHFLKRDYLPDLGRWLTTDPLDFADGPNLYACVLNNPLIFQDVYGLTTQSMAKQDSFFSFSSLSKMASFGGFGIFGNLATADFTPLPNSPSDKLFHYGDMLGRAYHAGDYSEVKMHLPEIKDTFLDFAGSMLPVVGPVGTASKAGAAGIRGMSSASGLLRAGNRLSQTRTFVNVTYSGNSKISH